MTQIKKNCVFTNATIFTSILPSDFDTLLYCKFFEVSDLLLLDESHLLTKILKNVSKYFSDLY